MNWSLVGRGRNASRKHPEYAGFFSGSMVQESVTIPVRNLAQPTATRISQLKGGGGPAARSNHWFTARRPSRTVDAADHSTRSASLGINVTVTFAVRP